MVFENIEDFHARIDDETLDIDENCVMVLKNCGPKGYPGMAEVGNMPLPPKVLQQGHHRHGAHQRCAHERHGLRHRGAAHRARSGGRRPAGASCRTATSIELDVPSAPLHLHVSDEELARAPRRLEAAEPPLERGYWKLYVDHVLQADQGADLDFLVGKRGAFVPRDNH